MRDLGPLIATAIQTGYIVPVVLVQLTFRSGTRNMWTGRGDLVWAGYTFSGIGSLGQVGAIEEGVEVKASGTSVSLSGIDPTLLAESLTDVQLGAPAKIWVGFWAEGTLLGAPYLNFAGVVDKPITRMGTAS